MDVETRFAQLFDEALAACEPQPERPSLERATVAGGEATGDDDIPPTERAFPLFV